MKFPDCHLYSSESATGDPLQVLVPLGSAPADAFRAAHRAWDGAPWRMECAVLGSTLNALMDALQKPGDPAEKEQCLAIYAAYPRKVGRPAALRAIKAALAKLPYEMLLKRTMEYAAAVESWPESQRQFVPYAQKFFNDERYMDDPKQWERNDALPKELDHSTF